MRRDIFLVAILLSYFVESALALRCTAGFAIAATPRRALLCASHLSGLTHQARHQCFGKVSDSYEPVSGIGFILHQSRDENAEYEDDVAGSKSNGISDDFLEEVKEGAPSEFNVMKQLLGINIFTYVLAAACVFFLGMNAFLGPGWLGQTIGLKGTGTFTEISDSLPGNIDLSGQDNLL